MPHIEVIALRSFPWSENGYTEIQAVEKSTFMLPDRMFEGLNKAGYVRRATIGDGHFALEPKAAEDTRAPTTETPVIETVEIAPAAPVVDAGAVASADNMPPQVVGAVIMTGLATLAKAPQPPVRTAELSDDEKAGLADGSWANWRFFKQRSVAAKISDTAILNGDDAKAAIEAYLAKE